MLAIAMLVAASLEIEIAGGVAKPLDPPEGEGPAAVGLHVRGGVDFFEHVTASLGIFGVPGPGSVGGAAFQAISALALVRVHSAGEVQGFVEAGVGPGQLITLAAEDHFENPPQHGEAGVSFWLGAGGRWFAADRFTLGVTAAWTNWSNVSRPAFTSGATPVAASSTLKSSALLLLFDLGWSIAL